MKRLTLSVLTLTLALPGPALAKRKPKPMPVPAFYEQASPTLATVEFVQEFVAGGQKQQTRGLTDGVVISGDGLVLISGKVRFPQRGSSGRLSGGSLPELSDFRLFFADGRRLHAVPVAFHDDLNLGLLRITDVPAGAELPHVTFYDPYEAQVGDGLRTMTLYTEEYGRKPVFSGVGVTALLDTPQPVWSVGGASGNLLGAPLWDEAGRAVGVVAEVPMSPWAGRQVVPDLSGPVGLDASRFLGWIDEAVAAEQARASRVADAPEEKEEEAAWLGILYEPLDRDLAGHLKISDGGGVVVTQVVEGSPAAKAGLQPLDVLIELAGERVAVREDADTPRFAQKIRQLKPGSTVPATVERPGGERLARSITLIQAPKTNLHADRRTDAPFELTVRETTLDSLVGQRLPPDTAGVVIDGVTGAGWAGMAGLRVGLIIQRVNEHEVTDLDSFEAAMAAVEAARPDKVLFFVRYGRSTRFLVAEPDWIEPAE